MTRPTGGSRDLVKHRAHFASFRRLIDNGVNGVAVRGARNLATAMGSFRAAYERVTQSRPGRDAAYGALMTLSMARRLAGGQDAGLRSLARTLPFEGIRVAQHTTLGNHLGILHGEREEYRQATSFCIRACTGDDPDDATVVVLGVGADCG